MDMNSPPNPTSWSPYYSYKDCSSGICSIYCPQWCYIIFPPPPPFTFHDSDSGANFSPLIIVVIGFLGSALLLVSYYTIISKYCRGRQHNEHQNSASELEVNQSQVTHGQLQPPEVASNGLDESLIKSIAIYKYKKRGHGLIEGTDCAVCLSEFQANESVRLLPKCKHAFHVPCIDKWLRSHSNCPLCRSNVALSFSPLALQSDRSSSTVRVSSLQIRRESDLVLVVDDLDGVHQEMVGEVVGNFDARNGVVVQENGVVGVQEVQSHLVIADILDIREDEEDLEEQNFHSHVENGSDRMKR